ncbi:MAG TPA: glycosyl hydrolase family 18 protein [Flavipsychrobacter sp.]|nr:glycosyl hydrolase family 18 protein [Flavipsychrobacter sp.]
MFKSLLALLLTVSGLKAFAQKTTITGYYAGDEAHLDAYNHYQLDYIIFSFCHLKGNRLHVANAADSALIRKMVSYKQTHPGLKVLLSLGGWGGCATCSPVFATKKGREEFAASARELLAYFKADGIDLDWEYPVVAGYPGHPYRTADRQNFTLLVKAMRNQFGPNYEISFASGGSTICVDSSFEWKKVMEVVDKVNLMSYDLVHGNSTASGHHTALYSTPQQLESTDNAVRKMIAAGVPSRKIIIGAATYARVFQVADTTDHGLYRKAVFDHAISYKDLYDSLASRNGFIQYYDPVSKSPYAFHAGRKAFVTYDDSVSIREKMLYVKKMNLGGIMFWQLMDDKPQDGVLNMMYSVRKNEE